MEHFVYTCMHVCDVLNTQHTSRTVFNKQLVWTAVKKALFRLSSNLKLTINNTFVFGFNDKKKT